MERGREGSLRRNRKRPDSSRYIFEMRIQGNCNRTEEGSEQLPNSGFLEGNKLHFSSFGRARVGAEAEVGRRFPFWGDTAASVDLTPPHPPSMDGRGRRKRREKLRKSRKTAPEGGISGVREGYGPN